MAETQHEMKQTFVVLGKPIAQPRHRATFRGGFAKMYIPREHPVHDFKQRIIDEALRHNPVRIEGCVRLDLMFAFAQPKGRTGQFKMGKPDLDNLEKAVMDALTTAGVWCDDAQVVEKHSAKVYGKIDATSIFVTPLEFSLDERIKK